MMPTAATPDTATRLAGDRTRLAYERTMMAWVRTALSLISFGFTIYKFFQFELQRSQVAAGALGPREFALVMIGIGLVALLLAAVEHRAAMKSLRASYGPQPRSTAAVVAALVSVMGLLALAAVIARA